MTEQEWELSVRPWPLWHHVADLDLLTVRKKSLFAIAACRRILGLIRDHRSLRVIEACDAFVDGGADFDSFCEASAGAFAAARELEQIGNPGEVQLAAHAAKWLSPDGTKLARAAEFAGEAIGFRAISRAGLVPADIPLNEALAYWDHSIFVEAMATEERAQAELIRELFGNPFRQDALCDEWCTTTAMALARQIYKEQDYSILPILADALQEAECDNDDLLNHCRDVRQVHVRGCWVVDLILGKA